MFGRVDRAATPAQLQIGLNQVVKTFQSRADLGTDGCEHLLEYVLSSLLTQLCFRIALLDRHDWLPPLDLMSQVCLLC